METADIAEMLKVMMKMIGQVTFPSISIEKGSPNSFGKYQTKHSKKR